MPTTIEGFSRTHYLFLTDWFLLLILLCWTVAYLSRVA